MNLHRLNPTLKQGILIITGLAINICTCLIFPVPSWAAIIIGTVIEAGIVGYTIKMVCSEEVALMRTILCCIAMLAPIFIFGFTLADNFPQAELYVGVTVFLCTTISLSCWFLASVQMQEKKKRRR